MYVASGEVDGSVANQFSLDEKDGVLRVSTTQDELKIVGAGVTQSATQTRTSNVFILRQEGSRLAVKGSVRNLAPGESIMSTRFVGRYGYVVTFLQKDPLFVVDLADEMNPKVLGQLTIPGFSSYMHPIDDGHLLTIGQDADGNGRTTGLALQVFDVTAPTSPRLAHKFTFQGNDYGYSEASQNHKAFTYYASKKLLAFPYVSSGPQGFRSTLEVFDVDPTQGIRRRGAVDHSKLFTSPVGYCGGYYGVDVRRGLFMDNNLVSISYGGIVTSSLDNLTQAVATLPFEAPPVASLPYCGSGASTEPSGPVTSKPAPATATPAPRAP
jgi:uncharacterized secreted protein with C-terminal beta-propeller domain